MRRSGVRFPLAPQRPSTPGLRPGVFSCLPAFFRGAWSSEGLGPRPESGRRSPRLAHARTQIGHGQRRAAATREASAASLANRQQRARSAFPAAPDSLGKDPPAPRIVGQQTGPEETVAGAHVARTRLRQPHRRGEHGWTPPESDAAVALAAHLDSPASPLGCRGSGG